MRPGGTGALDVTRTTLAVFFIGALLAANFWIIRPFLTSLVWAAMIVVATWPVMTGLQARLGHSRGAAVAVMTVLILMTVIVPFLVAVITLIGREDEVARRINDLSAFRLPPPPDWVGKVPLAGGKIADAWQHLAALGHEELAAQLAPLARKAMRWFVARAGSVAMMVVQFFLMVVISAALYAKGEAVASGVRGFARRLAGPHGEGAVVLAAKAVRGVALGTVVTAVIQSFIGGVGLIVAGVPGLAPLTAVMFMLSLAQVGPGVVLVPAAAWLYFSGGALWGIVLLAFSVFASGVKTFVRPLLIKRGADLSVVLVVPGVIGGLMAFGIMGLFVGPVVLAVTYALLKAWVSAGQRVEAADR